jgi:hypothetical protein
MWCDLRKRKNRQFQIRHGNVAMREGHFNWVPLWFLFPSLRHSFFCFLFYFLSYLHFLFLPLSLCSCSSVLYHSHEYGFFKLIIIFLLGLRTVNFLWEIYLLLSNSQINLGYRKHCLLKSTDIRLPYSPIPCYSYWINWNWSELIIMETFYCNLRSDMN